MAKEYIEREAYYRQIDNLSKGKHGVYCAAINDCMNALDEQPAADVVEADKVAEMLRNLFGDDCACNYNDLDEWLPTKCKYAETECPMPKERLGCWKELVKHYLAKMGGERRTEND